MDGSLNVVFLVTAPGLVSRALLLDVLWNTPGVVDAELDDGLAQATAPPSGLWRRTPVSSYGTAVWDGYANQPASPIVHLNGAQARFMPSEAGLSRILTPGVDPNHLALARVLVPGYDFTRNRPGGSEMADLPPTIGQAAEDCEDCEPVVVNQYSSPGGAGIAPFAPKGLRVGWDGVSF